MSKSRARFEQQRVLHITSVIASYLPFIGIIWASRMQLKNKLYALWYWFISIIISTIVIVKVGLYFNWF